MISPCENKNSFYDLSRDEIINLLKLSPNFELSIDESIENTNAEGYKIVKNKYRIVNSRINSL